MQECILGDSHMDQKIDDHRRKRSMLLITQFILQTSTVVNVRHNNVTKTKSGKEGWRTIGSGKHKYRANSVPNFSVKPKHLSLIKDYSDQVLAAKRSQIQEFVKNAFKVTAIRIRKLMTTAGREYAADHATNISNQRCRQCPPQQCYKSQVW